VRLHVNNADVLDAVINVSGVQALAEIVAAPGVGKAIRVMGYVFTCPSGATVQWKSAGSARSGPMTLTNGISAPSPGPGGRQFQCAMSQALNLTTDTAGVYGGHLSYQIVEASA
jgi:hypothetical protein